MCILSVRVKLFQSAEFLASEQSGGGKLFEFIIAIKCPFFKSKRVFIIFLFDLHVRLVSINGHYMT